MGVLCKVGGLVQRRSCSSKLSTSSPVNAGFVRRSHSANANLYNAAGLGRNCKDAIWSRARPSRARLLIVRRTSEHWWEDEAEFDAIKDKVLPKHMHLAIIEVHDHPLSDGSQEWSAISNGKAHEMLIAAGGKFASAFASHEAEAIANELWHHLGQDGPPFFKKVRHRAGLDTLEDAAASAAAVAAAAQSVWSELCSQNWRVELDYGLAGSEAKPRDELLLVVSGLAAGRLLAHAGVSAEAAARSSGYVLVAVEDVAA